MKNLINFLSRINQENHFVDLYFVGTHLRDTRTIDSILCYDKDSAQEQCDYLNHKYNTNMYRVCSTCMHI